MATTREMKGVMLYSCSNGGQCLCGCHSLIQSSMLAESAKAVLMNGSSITQRSILLDNGEYFFDDDFSIPFDANLREENNNTNFTTSQDSHESRDGLYLPESFDGSNLMPMSHSRSDSCLYQLETVVDIPINEDDDDDEETRMDTATTEDGDRSSRSQTASGIDFYINDDDDNRDLRGTLSDMSQTCDEPLFSPRNSSIASSMRMSSDRGMGQGFNTSSISSTGEASRELRHLLEQGRKPRSSDYRLTYCNVLGASGEDAGLAKQLDQNERSMKKAPGTSTNEGSTTASSTMSTWAGLANTRKFTSHQDLCSMSNTSTSISSWGAARRKPLLSGFGPGTRPRVVQGLTTWGQQVRSGRSSVLSFNSINEDSDSYTHSPGPPIGMRPPVRSQSCRTTWKQMKDVVSGELVSWKQLKQVATGGQQENDQRRRGSCQSATMSTETGVPASTSCGGVSRRFRKMTARQNSDGNDVVELRSHSEPRSNNTRYSGTLLEIYQRAQQAQSGSSSSDNNTVEDCQGNHRNHSNRTAGTRMPPSATRLLGISPSEETADGRPVFAVTIPSRKLSDIDNRQLCNFGAQFPPPFDDARGPLVSERQSRTTSRNPVQLTTPVQQLSVMSNRPRSSSAARRIAYPGLGTLAIPKQSRLQGTAFLSRTLPDLSFLARERVSSAPARASKPTGCGSGGGDSGFESTNDAHNAVTRGCNAGGPGRPGWIPICRKCGCSANLSPGVKAADQGESGETTPVNSPLYKTFTSVPDLSVGYRECSPSNSESTRQLKSCLVRRRSGDDGSMEHEHDRGRRGMDRTRSEPNVAAIQEAYAAYEDGITELSSSQEDEMGECRAKKSVSFSERILFHQMSGGSPLYQGGQRPINLISDLKVIPRDCGLYGQDPPLAQFQLGSPLSSKPGDKEADLQIRSQALVDDVNKSVQRTVAHFMSRRDLQAAGYLTPSPSNSSQLNELPANNNQDSSSTEESGADSPLLALISPLTTLIMDGLQPPSKNIFTASAKVRTRLWVMVEESCRPGQSNRVLSEVFREVKSLPALTADRTKFRAFVCACLNAKCLHMWVNALVQNDALLKRYYFPDAFVRQCLSTQRTLYADLSASLELLLNLPFRLDVVGEAQRRPSKPPPAPSTTRTSVIQQSTRGRSANMHQPIKKQTASSKHIPATAPASTPTGPIKRVVSSTRIELSSTTAARNPKSPDRLATAVGRSTKSPDRLATAVGRSTKSPDRLAHNQSDRSNNNTKAHSPSRPQTTSVRQRTEDYLRRTAASPISLATATPPVARRAIAARQLPGDRGGSASPVSHRRGSAGSPSNNVNNNGGVTSPMKARADISQEKARATRIPSPIRPHSGSGIPRKLSLVSRDSSGISDVTIV